MNKIRTVGAILAVLAALAFVQPASANATTTADTPSATSHYTHSEIFRCAVYGQAGINPCFGLEVYTTSTSSQIWINGHVTCYAQQGDIRFTWCGVGGGNGTGTLNIGVNFTIGGVVTGLWERMNIPAGTGTCKTSGSNSNTHGIQSWYNEQIICKDAILPR